MKNPRPLHPRSHGLVEPLESRIAPALLGVNDVGNIVANGGTQIGGTAAGGAFGNTVSIVGDVNNDGIDDAVIGAPNVANFDVGPGTYYVIFGTTDGIPADLDLSTLNGSNGFQIVGGNRLGLGVQGVGDFNGDLVDDFLILADRVGSSDPAGYIVFGKNGNFPSVVNVASLVGPAGFAFTTAATGFASIGHGDFNGDGRGDVILGFPEANKAFVVVGAISNQPVVNLDTITSPTGFAISVPGVQTMFGASVAMGDVNDDERDDIIVSAPQFGASGQVAVVYGRPDISTVPVNVAGITQAQGFLVSSSASGSRFGASVDAGADVNGDGVEDLVIGAPGFGTAGTAYVIYGKATPVSFKLNFDVEEMVEGEGFLILGAKTHGAGGKTDKDLGRTVQFVGDTNGDGFDDVAASTAGGVTYVVFGKEEITGSRTFGLPAVEVSKLSPTDGIQIGTPFSKTAPNGKVSGRGDLNADGVDDLLFGIPAFGAKGSAPGSTFVIYGSEFVLTSSISAVILDSDGDLITIKLKKGTLGSDVLDLMPTGDGFALRKIDLTAADLIPNKAVLKISVDQGLNGDGKTMIGTIDASGINLKKVIVEGDVVQVMAGESVINPIAPFADRGGGPFEPILPGMTFFKALSLGAGGGFFGLTGQFAVPGGVGRIRIAGDVTSMGAIIGAGSLYGLRQMLIGGSLLGSDFQIGGTLGSMVVKQQIKDTTLRVGKSMRTLLVLDDVDNSTVRAGTKLSQLVVGGSVEGSEISAPGVLNPSSLGKATAFGNITIKEGMDSSVILAGYDRDGLPVNPDVRIGKVVINGGYSASSIVAGAESGPDGIFGTTGDTAISGGNSLPSRIASIIIKGAVSGTPGAGDGFGIVAQQIGSIKLGSTQVALTSGASNDTTPISLAGNIDLNALEI